jgi:hypothetical protein
MRKTRGTKQRREEEEKEKSRKPKAPPGLTWNAFRSWYAEHVGKAVGGSVTEAWSTYKETHGVETKKQSQVRERTERAREVEEELATARKERQATATPFGTFSSLPPDVARLLASQSGVAAKLAIASKSLARTVAPVILEKRCARRILESEWDVEVSGPQKWASFVASVGSLPDATHRKAYMRFVTVKKIGKVTKGALKRYQVRTHALAQGDHGSSLIRIDSGLVQQATIYTFARPVFQRHPEASWVFSFVEMTAILSRREECTDTKGGGDPDYPRREAELIVREQLDDLLTPLGAGALAGLALDDGSVTEPKRDLSGATRKVPTLEEAWFPRIEGLDVYALASWLGRDVAMEPTELQLSGKKVVAGYNLPYNTAGERNNYERKLLDVAVYLHLLQLVDPLAEKLFSAARTTGAERYELFSGLARQVQRAFTSAVTHGFFGRSIRSVLDAEGNRTGATVLVARRQGRIWPALSSFSAE